MESSTLLSKVSLVTGSTFSHLNSLIISQLQQMLSSLSVTRSTLESLIFLQLHLSLSSDCSVFQKLISLSEGNSSFAKCSCGFISQRIASSLLIDSLKLPRWILTFELLSRQFFLLSISDIFIPTYYVIVRKNVTVATRVKLETWSKRSWTQKC